MVDAAFIGVIVTMSATLIALAGVLTWLSVTKKNSRRGAGPGMKEKVDTGATFEPRITHCVVASDANPEYYEFWPTVKRAWREICGVKAVLVMVADRVPKPLQSEADVILWQPVDGVHPGFQAQCIRLLYPALVETNGMVIISDMDLIPLSGAYFQDAVEKAEGEEFFCYRNVLSKYKQYPMCFNAARPRVWGDVFEVQSEGDVRNRISEMSKRCGMAYTAKPGGPGWFCDQTTLFDRIERWSKKNRGRFERLSDKQTGHVRLNRGDPDLDAVDTQTVAKYTDFHMPRPRSHHAETIDSVLECAVTLHGKG